RNSSCYQSSRSKETEIAFEKHRHKREYSRRTKAVSESKGRQEGTGSQNQRSKSRVLRMTYPNHRIVRKRITQTFSPKSVISFPNLGEEDGMEGPMIIEEEIRGHCVHSMYLDGGSSLKILYEHYFSKFRPKIKNQLIPANTPLVGFSGEIIWPLGQISLLVKIGDEEHSTSAWMNFMVVRSPSTYNGIIGRTWVSKIRAIPSTAYGMLKFLVAGEIVTLQRSRIIPLECSMVLEPRVPRRVINQVAEENIQVAIHSEYPKQTIAIGSTIIEEGRKELCGLLRRHLDVFS
nr:reverse transcriptase domain-containing protein [Tanacetum cinerariifolium]